MFWFSVLKCLESKTLRSLKIKSLQKIDLSLDFKYNFI